MPLWADPTGSSYVSLRVPFVRGLPKEMLQAKRRLILLQENIPLFPYLGGGVWGVQEHTWQALTAALRTLPPSPLHFWATDSRMQGYIQIAHQLMFTKKVFFFKKKTINHYTTALLASPLPNLINKNSFKPLEIPHSCCLN